MKEEKFRIITIGRRLGCGGSQIGHEAARRLGLECYDKRLIEMACSYGDVDLETDSGALMKKCRIHFSTLFREKFRTKKNRSGHCSK